MVRLVCVGMEVQRTHVCWRSCVVVIPVTAVRMLVLLERSQLSESLAEECEAVGEARPARRVARISVFHRRCDGSVLLKHHWSRGSMVVCVA